jgi:hypothetical protein
MKTVILKRLAIGSVFTLFLFSLAFMNFVDSTNVVDKYRTSYQEKIVRYTRVAPSDVARLSGLEKNDLRKIEEVRDVVKTVDQNNDFTTVVTIVSTNEYEPWVKKPARIISDKNGTTVYDQNNAVLASSPISALGRQDYNNMKSKIGESGLRPGPEFPTFTDAQMNQIRAQGGQISTVSGGKIRIVKGDLESLYDATNKAFQITRKVEGRISNQLLYDYADVNGKLTPVSKYEKQFETLPSGVCVEKVTLTTFSNYNFVSTAR